MDRYNIDEMFFQHCCTSSEIAANEDIFNGDPSTDILNMANWRDAYFIIVKSAGASGVATVTVTSTDDASGSNTQDVAFRYKAMTTRDTWGNWTAATSSGFDTTAGANQMYIIHVRAEELDSSYNYVYMTMTEETDGAVDGAVLAILANPRYAEDVSATAIT